MVSSILPASTYKKINIAVLWRTRFGVNQGISMFWQVVKNWVGDPSHEVFLEQYNFFFLINKIVVLFQNPV